MSEHADGADRIATGIASFTRIEDIPDIPGRVRDRLDRWRADVLSTRFEPVAEVLNQAAAAAERIALDPGLAEGRPESDRDGAAALLARLADEVLEPVREILEETDLCAGLPLSLLETLHELRSETTNLGERVSIPEDAGLYDAHADDPAAVRVRKALVRTRRRLPGSPDGPPRRLLPLRSVALYHVAERVGAEEIRTTLERREQIALALAGIERTLADLTHAVLETGPDRASDPEAAANAARDRLLTAAGVLGPLPATPIAREEWESDLRTSGTFLGENRTLGDERVRRRLTRLTRHAERWASWQKEITDRLSYCVRLIAVRYEMDAAARSVRANLSDDLAAPAEALHAFARIIREAESDIPTDALSRQTLEGSAWLAETETRLTGVLERTILDTAPEERITEDVSAAIDALHSDAVRIRDRFGTTFHLHSVLPQDAASVDPRIDPTEVDLGDILAQGLDPLGEEAFAASVGEAAESLVEALLRVPELREVIRYNLRAADATPEDEDDDVRPADVVQTGLSRASEAADSMADRVRERSRTLDQVIARAVEQAWIHIHERARVQRQMQGAVMDLQREVDVQFRRASETTRTLWTRFSRSARRNSMRGLVLSRRLIRRGREAVGAVSDERAGYHETIAALSSLDEMLGQVPPIYRRLFSFSPVTDHGLLVGREQDMAFLKKHVALWDVGVPQALIFHGSPSSGRTSLLNVFRHELGDSNEFVRIVLGRDLSTEAAVIAALSETGALQTQNVKTLFELGSRILEQPRPENARVFVVENLGSLMTRTIGGFDLIAEFIAFMSRTDSRWMWVATMSESGWKALVTARPEAASLAISRTLEPIDRPGLERLVMQRHRRSGVPVEFLEPPDPSPLLRRRLRTAIGSEQKQRLLREAWFDRLFALTGQDIMMALFYWIRAVEMTESEDRLLIHWFSPIRFDFLAGFSMDQAFALQAILERGLLTVEQHAETNLISRQESHRIMESLGNAMLIEPVVDGPSPTRFDYSAIQGETAYRIRPLVVHPVIRFLRDRNIVH